MEIGEEIFIKAKVVNFDSNPNGCAVQVEVKGYIDDDEMNRQAEERKRCGTKTIKYWIHRTIQAEAIHEPTVKKRRKLRGEVPAFVIPVK